MEQLSNWFTTLDPTLKVFWGCAAVSSVVFLLQMLLTLLGMDHDTDMDFDAGHFDGDTMDEGGSLSLFSLRSLVNFFVGFGWAGVSFYGLIPQKWMLYLASMAVGLCFGYMYFFIRRQTKKLESDGTINICESLGKTCDVYLRIPGQQGGQGKVQISLHGSIHELPALTSGPMLASGTRVRVVEVLGGGVLRVEPV